MTQGFNALCPVLALAIAISLIATTIVPTSAANNDKLGSPKRGSTTPASAPATTAAKRASVLLRNADISGENAASLTSQVRANPADELLRQESRVANAKIEMSPFDKTALAGHHHGSHHHGMYQYVEVPKKGAFKMGFKRGNHKHWIMRKESQHGPHNHGYFKWHDKKGKGSHKWDYNHYKHKKHYHHKA